MIDLSISERCAEFAAATAAGVYVAVPPVSEPEQLDMLCIPIVSLRAKPGERLPIAQRFVQFHTTNPQVYAALVFLARDYLRRTKLTRVGIKALYEKARWEFAVRGASDGEFSLDNSFTSLYARLISEREPDLRNAFELRPLRAKAA